MIESVFHVSDEYEIPLTTSDIQHGHFDIHQDYHLILLCEGNILKLFDNVQLIDHQPWDCRISGPVNNILWQRFQNGFFILTWNRLFVIPIIRIKRGYRSTFSIGRRQSIDQVKSIDYRKPHWEKKQENRLRFITMATGAYLYVNRGYHTIEQWNIQAWVCQSRWQKSRLDLNNRDEIRLITCSDDGKHLAMNIHTDLRLWHIE